MSPFFHPSSLRLVLIVLFPLAALVSWCAGASPPTPQVPLAGAEAVAELFFAVLHDPAVGIDRGAIARALAGSRDTTGTVLFLLGRRHWFLGRGETAAAAVAEALELVRTNRAALEGVTEREMPLHLSFPGPRKRIPFGEGLLFGVSVVSGIDGIWAEKTGGDAFLLPQEAAASSAGELFPFLPVRFGLDRSRIVTILTMAAARRGPAWGKRGRNNVVPPEQAGALDGLLRFRSADFYCERVHPEGESRVLVTPLYRGAPLPDMRIDRGRILASARAAADWFIRHQHQSGAFSYRYDPFLDGVDASDYSIPRHAGTALILYRIHQHSGDTNHLRAAERALAFLKPFLRKTRQGTCILEGDQAKLGSTALTALALFARREASADRSEDKLLQELLDFIVSMQEPGGGLCGRYYPGDGSRVPPRVSQNFAGQALWALAKGVKAFGLHREALERGLDFHAASFWSFPFSTYYMFPLAWEMQAIEEAASFMRKPAWEAFLYRTADSMIESQYGVDAPFADYGGGFGTPEWFVPLAHAAGFQGEGLTAAYGMARLDGHADKRSHYEASLRLLSAFLLSQQVTRPMTFFYREPQRAIGSFRGGPADHRQQIDYTQHIVAALLNYLERMEE